MIPRVSSVLDNLLDQNEIGGSVFKIKIDPCSTKVGKFIRKTSLDKFTQFWSVLKGDMSLIGTQPPIVDGLRQYELLYHKKWLSMKLGLTGCGRRAGRSRSETLRK